jgi:hypothetical protein
MDAATLNSIIFIVAFVAIVVAGELLESHTRLQRCAALLGIVVIAAAAVRPATPPAKAALALGDTQARV